MYVCMYVGVLLAVHSLTCSLCHQYALLTQTVDWRDALGVPFFACLTEMKQREDAKRKLAQV
jgi:hypothetical protein